LKREIEAKASTIIGMPGIGALLAVRRKNEARRDGAASNKSSNMEFLIRRSGVMEEIFV
jgi:hypothetical protein